MEERTEDVIREESEDAHSFTTDSFADEDDRKDEQIFGNRWKTFVFKMLKWIKYFSMVEVLGARWFSQGPFLFRGAVYLTGTLSP